MTIIKADQVNVVSDKVKLTQAQHNHIVGLKDKLSRREIIETYINEPQRYDHIDGGINTLEFNKLIAALYMECEVEQTVEEQLLEYYERAHSNMSLANFNEQLWSGARMGMERALNIIGMKVKGINS